jgi:protoporphyrinogen oxidase
MDCEKIVIIGAGPAGLAAAYELIGSGIQSIILEKNHKIGGLARTETFRGYQFDIGGHRFSTKNQKIKRFGVIC